MRQGLDIDLRFGQRGAPVFNAMCSERLHRPFGREVVASHHVQAVGLQQRGKLAGYDGRIMGRAMATHHVGDEAAAVRVANAQHRCVVAAATQVHKAVIDQTGTRRQLERPGMVDRGVDLGVAQEIREVGAEGGLSRRARSSSRCRWSASLTPLRPPVQRGVCAVSLRSRRPDQLRKQRYGRCTTSAMAAKQLWNAIKSGGAARCPWE